eukprot:TRINITY_DN5403_c0_g1_i1.p1 TRINITY_DN5403_c0_g1~~TRINITY_DN5403_c0_g1_i1.p1  ORF type:complete len:759 (-),score=141.72 TRINITY_DN5403_c0_g1_i1:57-2333(-)
MELPILELADGKRSSIASTTGVLWPFPPSSRFSKGQLEQTAGLLQRSHVRGLRSWGGDSHSNESRGKSADRKKKGSPTLDWTNASGLSLRLADTHPVAAPVTNGFSKRLEDFIAKELAITGHSELNQDEITSLEHKLQVYSQAMQLLLENCRSYAPVISTFLKLVGSVLSHYRGIASQLPSLQQELSVIQQTASAQLESAKQQLLEQIQQLTKENASQAKRLEDREAQLMREASTNQEHEAKISNLLFEKKEEYDRCMLLITAVREAEEKCKELQIEIKRLKGSKEKVNELQAALDSAHAELAQYKEALTDNVPSSHYQKTSRLLEDTRVKLANTTMEMKRMSRLRDTAERDVHNLREEIDILKEENANLRSGKATTPRPNWDQMAHRLPAEFDAEELVRSTTTVDKTAWVVDHLVSSLEQRQSLETTLKSAQERLNWIEGATSEKNTPREQTPLQQAKFLMGLGTGKEVPKYLKWHGKVRNRNLAKREIEILLKDFWREKIRHDQQQGQRSPMEDFMYTFLKQRHGIQPAICEWGYNIRDACQRFKFDADCELFLTVLDGRLSEQVYHDQFQMIDQLKQQILALEVTTHGARKTGIVKKKAVLDFLPRFFSTKSDKDILRLKFAISKDFPGSDIEVEKLFSEDREGNQKEFVEMVRDQMVAETIEYISELEQAIYERGNQSSGTVGIEAARDAIVQVDPLKPLKEVEKIICRGLGVSEGTELPWSQAVDLDRFLKNIKEYRLQRSTKRIDAPETSDS